MRVLSSSQPLVCGTRPKSPGGCPTPRRCCARPTCRPCPAEPVTRDAFPLPRCPSTPTLLALWWPKSRPCPRFPSPLGQVTPPFPYPALRQEPVRTCVFRLGSQGCCSGTCLPPRRLAGSLSTPTELNLKRRATRARGHRCKRTRRSSAHVPFIPRGIFPRGLEPEGPGWEMCVSALRVFAGAVVTVTASEVA